MKKALLIGISNYNGKYSNLPGCLNDMNEWASLLKSHYGFTTEGTRLLADNRATKMNILDRLEWLFSGDGLDEIVLFFAGHGARLRRRDYETGDLDDNMDETLVCFPEVKEDIQEHLLFDDELLGIIQSKNLPDSVNVTFIFDSCHSGGMARTVVISDETDIARSIVLPSDIAARTIPDLPIKRMGSLNQEDGINHVIVSAALDIESAWDAKMDDGLRHGAFSYYATRFLEQNTSMSYASLIDNVTEKVTERFPQHPRLLGNNGRFNSAFLK
ncbi:MULTISPECIES: caspase family protein [Vibrio]|uniref:caspase family protein n=1 Tax=Vibrio TaxID=662 RepID=UPI000C7A8E20|nr:MULTISPECIES: caspase family protein [Vibrio]PLR57620.1 hypothetical protein CYU11_11095 [Vibrio parahaemolyticus]